MPETDAIPPKPTTRPRDWLDDILDSPPPAAPAAPEAETEPPAPPPADPEPAPAAPAKPKPPKARTAAARRRRRKRKKPKPGQPYTPWDARPVSPRQSLLDAWAATPYRLKWLAYHAAAAYLGWSVGLVDWATYVTAWLAADGFVGVQAFFWYGAAACTFLLYRRTRGAWLPVAWLAAVPATSTVVGVLLYGTPTP